MTFHALNNIKWKTKIWINFIENNHIYRFQTINYAQFFEYQNRNVYEYVYSDFVLKNLIYIKIHGLKNVWWTLKIWNNHDRGVIVGKIELFG